MDAVFVNEIKCLSGCGKQSSSRAFILQEKGEGNELEIVEIDLLISTIYRRFAVANIDKMSLLRGESGTSGPKRSTSSEGYHLFFSLETEKLFLSYPNGCLAVYDTGGASTLKYVMQTHGKNPYIMTTIALSQTPSDSAHYLFFGALGQRNIYMLNIKNLDDPLSYKTPYKFRIANNVKVRCLVTSHRENIFYAACSDGLIRGWNYSTQVEIVPYGMFVPGKGKARPTGIRHKQDALNLIRRAKLREVKALSLSSCARRLLAGDENGNICVFVLGTEDPGSKLPDSHVRSFLYQVLALTWINYSHTQLNSRFICLSAKGGVYIFHYQYFDPNIHAPSNLDSEHLAKANQ